MQEQLPAIGFYQKATLRVALESETCDQSLVNTIKQQSGVADNFASMVGGSNQASFVDRGSSHSEVPVKPVCPNDPIGNRSPRLVE